jgi:hypothetical protein
VEIIQLTALTSLLLGEYPATELLSTVNSTIAPFLLSLPCRLELNCQPSTDWVPGWRQFHTNFLVFSPQADFQLNCTQPAWGPRYIGPNRKNRVQQSLYCCYGRLPSDSSDIVDLFTGRYQATHIPSRYRCIVTVLHATIYCMAVLG